MKIVLLSATSAAMPCMDWLLRQGCMLTLLCPPGGDQCSSDVEALQAWAEVQGIPCWQVDAGSVDAELSELIQETAPDLVLRYGFPLRITPSLIDRMPCRSWNVHFGFESLPDDTGRLRGTITLHEWKGAGEKVLQQHRLLLGAGESDPIARLSELSVPVLAQALQDLNPQRRNGTAGPGIAAIF
ncbi:hypothetical protein [Flaviaesturariibacter amylovorans]